MGADDKPTVVTGTGHPSLEQRLAFLKKRRKLFIIVTFVVVAALAAGAYFMFKPDATKTPANGAKSGSKLAPAKVSYKEISNEDLVSKVNYLIGSKQYDEAEKLIKTQKNYESDKTKLSLLASVQSASNQDEAAAETNAKIEDIGNLQPGEYALLARKYADGGDKTKAIEYYRKSIDAYNKEQQGSYKQNVTRLEAAIKDLQ